MHSPTLIKIQLQAAPETERIACNEVGEVLGFHYLPFMKFPRNKDLEAVQKLCKLACERNAMYSERIFLGKTYAKQIDSAALADVSVRWIDDDLGYGLFAEQEMKRWDFVGVYTGEVRRRRWFGWGNSDYTFRYPIGELYPKRFVIESSDCGNVTRFINHSDDPNCTVMAVYHQGIMHLVVYTHRPVKEGEQLTFDYGGDYWGKRSYLRQP